MRGLLGIGGAQRPEPGIAVPRIVAIDVVADHQERLRFLARDLVPHVLFGRLVVAAAEREPGYRGRGVQRRVRTGFGQLDRLAQGREIGGKQIVRAKRDFALRIIGLRCRAGIRESRGGGGGDQGGGCGRGNRG